VTTLEASPSTPASDATASSSERTESTGPSAEANGDLADPTQVCGFIEKVLADGAAAGVDAPDFYIAGFGLEAINEIARPSRPIMDDVAVKATCPDDYATFIIKSGVGSLQFF